MIKWIKKVFRKKETVTERRETEIERRERLKKLCDDRGCMDAQVAVNELKKYLLGEDWYIVDPINNLQANAIIVDEIESMYRRK